MAREKLIADMLGDEEACSLLIQKSRESGHVEKDIAPVSLRPISCFTLLGASPPVAMEYEHKQPPHLPWFRMDVGPAWFFMYARPGSGW